jgi:hypothetical protein
VKNIYLGYRVIVSCRFLRRNTTFLHRLLSRLNKQWGIESAIYQTSYCVTFFLFSQPNSLSPPPFFPSGGPHFLIHSIFSIWSSKAMQPPSTDFLILTNKPLKTFRLDCYYGVKQDNISNIFDAWLEALIRRRVQQLHLNLHNHTLNLNIFISETLIVLKLKNLIITTDASCVHLPSLKTLHLEYMIFSKI